MARNITITFDDGSSHVYQNAPDSVTPEAVQARAEKEFSKPVKGIDGGRKASLADQIPGSSPIPQAATEQEDTSILGRIRKGLDSVVEPALALGSGAVAGVVGPAVGIVKGLTGGRYGTAEGAREASNTAADVAQALTYQPRSQAGQAITQGIGHVLDRSGVIGVAPMAGELANLGRAAAPVVDSAKIAGGAALDAGSSSLGRAAAAVTPEITKNISVLAQKAAQYDIPLRPDMLTNNKFAKIIGESLEKVPLSGAKTDARQTAFNKAIIKTIGGDSAAEKLTPDVFDSAMRTSGEKIGDISARTPVTIDKDLASALQDHLENAAKFETSDVQKVVSNYIDELTGKAENGTIPGEAFRKINSKINTQLRSTSNGDLKHALGGLQDDLQEAIQRHVSPDDLPALQEARKQYAISKTIEPLVAKSASGDISPAGLMGRVTANNSGKSRMARGNGGEIGDLARIGQQFIKEPGSSNTAERGLTYGMLGGGLAVHPATAAGIYGLANIYNRSGNALTRALTKRK